MRSLMKTVVALALLACSAFAQTPRTSMLVTPEWLAAHLKDPDVVVLHTTRDNNTFEAAHIPGARLVTFAELTTERPHARAELRPKEELEALFRKLGINRSSRVIVYGPPTAATRVYFTLDYLGFGDRTAVLDGGLERWQRENREIASGAAPPVKPGDFTAGKVRPEVVETLDNVRRAVEQGGPVVLVDARPPSRYAEGHLPGAVNLYWLPMTVGGKIENNNLAGDMTLKPAVELRRQYQEALGAPGKKKLVSYCEIGMQASHVYFTAKYLGYDVAMYDGSYEEWSSVPDAPIVKGEERGGKKPPQ